jgi:hypothetical protein
MLKHVGRTFETRHQNDLIDFGQTYGRQKYRAIRNIHDNGTCMGEASAVKEQFYGFIQCSSTGSNGTLVDSAGTNTTWMIIVGSPAAVNG